MPTQFKWSRMCQGHTVVVSPSLHFKPAGYVRATRDCEYVLLFKILGATTKGGSCLLTRRHRFSLVEDMPAGSGYINLMRR